MIGVLERGGKVHARVAPNRKEESIEAVVFPSVEKGTTVYTDEFPASPFAVREYEHKVINHLEKYVDGKIHTNGIENFWSLLKRGLSAHAFRSPGWKELTPRQVRKKFFGVEPC